MIRFAVYGVIAEKPRVGHLVKFIRAPYRMNYALNRTMVWQLFLMFSMSSITMQSLGRTTRAGCRPAVCENVVFVFFCLSRFESGGPFAGGGYT